MAAACIVQHDYMILTRIILVKQWKQKPDWNRFKRECWEKMIRDNFFPPSKEMG